MDTSQDRERIITVNISCDDCPEGARCAGCQAIMDAAVADTLAQGTDPRHVNVAQTAAEQRIALARKLGAEIIADPEGHECQHPEVVAATLVRAAEQTNRNLGLVQDTPEQAAQREAGRRARVQAVIDAIGA